MIIFATIVFSFLILRFTISLYNFITVTYNKPSTLCYSGNKKVSILVPARNEEDNLINLLDSIIEQRYTNFEILVYNDESEDNTLLILKNYEIIDKRIQVINGTGCPAGWTGKNNACHQLSLKATGDYYIFLDADVRLASNFLDIVIEEMTLNQYKLLSYFPSQVMNSTGEWLTIPLMNWILQSLLPLNLVEKTSFKSLSAANGQCMMFEAKSYTEQQWHFKVNSSCVEDIEIAQKAKELDYKVSVKLGTQLIYCKMYSSFKEAVNGFSKNILHYFPGKIFGAILFMFLIFAIPILSIVSIPLFIVALFLIIIQRILISYSANQNIIKNLRWHIPQMISFVFIISKAIAQKKNKKLQWKGRTISI